MKKWRGRCVCERERDIYIYIYIYTHSLNFALSSIFPLADLDAFLMKEVEGDLAFLALRV